MDNKKHQQLGSSGPASTLGGSTTASTDDTDQSEQVLDYHEHMGKRHKDTGHKINQAIVAEKQSKPSWRDQLAEFRDRMTQEENKSSEEIERYQAWQTRQMSERPNAEI